MRTRAVIDLSTAATATATATATAAGARFCFSMKGQLSYAPRFDSSIYAQTTRDKDTDSQTDNLRHTSLTSVGYRLSTPAASLRLISVQRRRRRTS